MGLPTLFSLISRMPYRRYIFTWGHVFQFHKCSVEGSNGRKTGGVCHLCHADSRTQYLTCVFDSQGIQEIPITHLHPLLKKMGDIIFIQIKFL